MKARGKNYPVCEHCSTPILLVSLHMQLRRFQLPCSLNIIEPLLVCRNTVMHNPLVEPTPYSLSSDIQLQVVCDKQNLCLRVCFSSYNNPFILFMVCLPWCTCSCCQQTQNNQSLCILKGVQTCITNLSKVTAVVTHILFVFQQVTHQLLLLITSLLLRIV